MHLLEICNNHIWAEKKEEEESCSSFWTVHIKPCDFGNLCRLLRAVWCESAPIGALERWWHVSHTKRLMRISNMVNIVANMQKRRAQMTNSNVHDATDAHIVATCQRLTPAVVSNSYIFQVKFSLHVCTWGCNEGANKQFKCINTSSLTSLCMYMWTDPQKPSQLSFFLTTHSNVSDVFYKPQVP